MSLKSVNVNNTNVSINFNSCPQCGEAFSDDVKSNKKRTLNHGIPKFIKPIRNILFPMCKECHEKLNSYYNLPKIQYRKNQVKSNTFDEFKENYEKLRDEFHSKKINRGEFGGGLWSNLVNYLESEARRKV